MLDFRLDLIDDLIDSFCSRRRLGWPCSLALAQLDRLNSSFDHWPDFMGFRARCVVCIVRDMRPFVTVLIVVLAFVLCVGGHASGNSLWC